MSRNTPTRLGLFGIVENVKVRERVETLLNKLYDAEEPPDGLPIRRQSCNVGLPEIIEIPHEGRLRILAFSDYRTQDIEELFHLLERLEEKPDLIIYAGDDVNRFAPIPDELLRLIRIGAGDCSGLELSSAWFSEDEYTLSSYGHVLRLPKEGADKDTAISRIFEVVRLIDAIKGGHGAANGLSEEDLLKVLAEYPTFKLRRTESGIDIVDGNTGAIIISFKTVSGHLTYNILSGYLQLYNKIKQDRSVSIDVRKIQEDSNFAYFYVLTDEPKRNVFEELAGYAKYGLVAVIGNDNDRFFDRHRIYGKNVYEVHNTWIIMGLLLIVGLGGSTCGAGPSGCYAEGSVRLRLELAHGLAESLGKKLLIVSHSPPRGVLDRAIRYSDAPIGSLALRDLIEESNNIALIVCGHVHSCGGNQENINNTTVVNVSSHDSQFNRANIGRIILNQDGIVEAIEWLKIPSLVETVLKRYDGEERLNLLSERVKLSKREVISFLRVYNRHGNNFLEDLEDLARMKFNYSMSWDNVLRLYDYGVKSPESITEPVYRVVLNESHGIEKHRLKQAFVKILRERKQGKIYLLSKPPLPSISQTVAFDTEYITDHGYAMGVLYGFLDLETGELKQFWLNEKYKMLKYLGTIRNKVFVFWGGADGKLLREELRCQASTFNMLEYVQTSLVAPVSSAELREVHDVLYGSLKEDKFWKHSFYLMDGIHKAALCRKILMEPSNMKCRKELAAANKADVLALQHIIEKIMQLQSSSYIRPSNISRRPTSEVRVYPIVDREKFYRIIHSIVGRRSGLRRVVRRLKKKTRKKVE